LFILKPWKVSLTSTLLVGSLRMTVLSPLILWTWNKFFRHSLLVLDEPSDGYLSILHMSVGLMHSVHRSFSPLRFNFSWLQQSRSLPLLEG
jgi:hypothetical protein